MGVGTLEWLISVGCLVIAVALVVALIRDVRAGDRTVSGLLAIEAVLVAHAVLGTVRLINEGGGVSSVTYVGYLLAVLLVLPAGFIWSASERNRGGTAVLLVAVLVVPFLMLRTAQVWNAGA